MNTIAIGDIHGCYKQLLRLMDELARADYDIYSERIIFLGDYIDRGPEPRNVVKYIRELQQKNRNVIALRGNHEQLCLDYFEFEDDTWLYNGGEITVNDYAEYIFDFRSDRYWFDSLPLYYEDDWRIYVHAGIMPGIPLDKQDDSDLLWIREEFLKSSDKFPKKVICGHTPTGFLTGDTVPYITPAGNIDIDTGCVSGGKLTAIIFDDIGMYKTIQI